MTLRLRQHDRGMTLIELLVSVAIVGVIAAVAATVFVDMTRMRVRGAQVADADNMLRFLRGALSNTNQCGSAFRTGPHTPPTDPLDPIVTWNNPNDPNGQQIGAIAIGNLVVLKKDQCLNNQLCVKQIVIRRPKGPSFREGPALSPVPYQSKKGQPADYDIYSAYLEITYQFLDGVKEVTVGGEIQTSKIPLTVGRNNASGALDLCFQDKSAQQIDQKSCDAEAPTGPDCIVDPNATDYCSVLYFVSGFDNAGKPKCVCHVYCWKLPPLPKAPTKHPGAPSDDDDSEPTGGN